MTAPALAPSFHDSEARCSRTLVHRYLRHFFERAGVPAELAKLSLLALSRPMVFACRADFIVDLCQLDGRRLNGAPFWYHFCRFLFGLRPLALRSQWRSPSRYILSWLFCCDLRCSLELSKHLQLQLASFVRCTQRSFFPRHLGVTWTSTDCVFSDFLFFLSFFFRSFFFPFLPEDDPELLEDDSLPEDDELLLDFLLYFTLL